VTVWTEGTTTLLDALAATNDNVLGQHLGRFFNQNPAWDRMSAFPALAQKVRSRGDYGLIAIGHQIYVRTRASAGRCGYFGRKSRQLSRPQSLACWIALKNVGRGAELAHAASSSVRLGRTSSHRLALPSHRLTRSRKCGKPAPADGPRSKQRNSRL